MSLFHFIIIVQFKLTCALLFSQNLLNFNIISKCSEIGLIKYSINMQLNLKSKSKFYLLHNIFKIHGSTLISGNESCRYTDSANLNKYYEKNIKVVTYDNIKTN